MSCFEALRKYVDASISLSSESMSYSSFICVAGFLEVASSCKSTRPLMFGATLRRGERGGGENNRDHRAEWALFIHCTHFLYS